MKLKLSECFPYLLKLPTKLIKLNLLTKLTNQTYLTSYLEKIEYVKHYKIMKLSFQINTKSHTE